MAGPSNESYIYTYTTMSKKIENLDLKSIVLPGIDEKRPLVIAGPCSAETEEQVMTTANALARYSPT